MDRCPNCGSTAQFKIKDVMVCDTYVQITYTCGCGVETQTRRKKDECINSTRKNG